MLPFNNTAYKSEKEEGYFELVCNGLFKIICCSQTRPNIEAKMLSNIENGVSQILKDQRDNFR